MTRSHFIILLSLLIGSLLVVEIVTPCQAQSSNGKARNGPFTNGTRSVRSRDVDQHHIRLDLVGEGPGIEIERIGDAVQRLIVHQN